MVSKSRDPHNGLIFLKIPVNPPYLKMPKPAINDLGLPKKDYYTTKDVCKVLGIKQDTFKYRIKVGYYPETIRVGGKRRFTTEQITDLIDLTE